MTAAKIHRGRLSGALAALAASASLLLAPSASADLSLTDAAGAEPDATSWWAGTCDLLDPTNTAAGTGPASAGHCIDEGAWGGFTPERGTPPQWRLAPAMAAGGHPDATATFSIRAAADEPRLVSGVAKDAIVELPPGVLANVRALPQCPQRDFRTRSIGCHPSTQVGLIKLRLPNLLGGGLSWSNYAHPVYNLEPRPGATAEFGVEKTALNLALTIFAKARTEEDFHVSTGVRQIPPLLALARQSITLWGVPWDSSHDRYRVSRDMEAFAYDSSGTFGITDPGFLTCASASGFEVCPQSYDPSWGPIRPFFTNPTECRHTQYNTELWMDEYANVARFTSDENPDPADPAWVRADSAAPPVSGCALAPFDPTITFDPTLQGAAANRATDTPTGLDVKLTIPQNNDLPFDPPPSGAPQGEIDQYVADATNYWRSPAGLATAHLKDTVVTLPEGLTLNPAAAGGQAVCTSAQIGLTATDAPAPTPIRFDNDDPSDGKGHDCPDSSKIAEVEVDTPLFDSADDPTGEVYLAAQGDNPFNSDFAIYIAVRSPQRDLVAKLAGKVEPDPVTGRLKATFANNPQVPVESFRLRFKAGPRAPLATPVTCGNHMIVSTLTPWSADHGGGGETDTVNDQFDLDRSPAGGCPTTPAERPFNLGFSAGSTELVGGAHSPFTVRLTRPDGDQEFDRVQVTTPEGLAAQLAGVPSCPDAAIAQAIGRTATGDGKLEQQSPSCPVASQVGTTTIGAGAGPSPYYVGGKVYLAGPYKGAPVSLAFIVPAVAGPFDLGVQVVRTALNINPVTAQVTAVSDTIPKILRGVPLRIRDIRIDVDRPGFTLNPTDCSEQQVSGVVSGASGAVANVSNRFQVAECARLGFKPKLNLRLFGSPKRAKYQRLRATLIARPGDANIARASVALPHSEFLAQEHIRTVCTRVQFAAKQCPAGSVYGKATAITPLLDQPLSGPVYLRSSSNKLPDLVAALRGPDNQPIEVELSGRTDSVHGGIRNTFDVVPDAPVSKFTLELQGGKKSLIINSRNICAGVQKATVKFDAQNGRKNYFQTKVVNPKCGKARKGSKKKSTAKKRPAAQRSLAALARGIF